MHFFSRRPFDLPHRFHTPREVYEKRKSHRRAFLQQMGLAGAVGILGASGCSKPSDDEIFRAGAVEPRGKSEAAIYPASRNAKYSYGRPETDRRSAAEYANFYEFSSDKDVWRQMPDFNPEEDWRITITGDCVKPRTIGMDDLYRALRKRFEERAYRLRCVETWAMCVPWTGVPLAELLKLVEPKPAAKFVAFSSFEKRDDAPNMSDDSYPWPYQECLTLAEAMNDLAFLATGIYGEPLPKQHGTPIRLVVPWKYGFKSIKSLVNITLTDRQPPSFWNSVWPAAYDLAANVDPSVRHPSWSQKVERMLGTGERYETQKYNGYGEYVGHLYST